MKKLLILFTISSAFTFRCSSQIGAYEEQQMKKASGKYFEFGALFDPPYTTFFKDPSSPAGSTWNESFIKKELYKLHSELLVQVYQSA